MSSHAIHLYNHTAPVSVAYTALNSQKHLCRYSLIFLAAKMWFCKGTSKQEWERASGNTPRHGLVQLEQLELGMSVPCEPAAPKSLSGQLQSHRVPAITLVWLAEVQTVPCQLVLVLRNTLQHVQSAGIIREQLRCRASYPCDFSTFFLKKGQLHDQMLDIYNITGTKGLRHAQLELQKINQNHFHWQYLAFSAQSVYIKH